ncbi:LuxR C-terminal-related transcriptional regulator [Marinobacter sp. DUT-3]|uniref:LuxR C-terminal-related transcriptional regulator n=1 Tax=unclassified Marinobacter TaxID=83889 RepID=UPI00387AB508
MKQVLILEDLKDAQRWLTGAVLTSFPEAQVHCCDTLGSALAWLDGKQPELCLVDLRLPDGSGVDFIRHCKSVAPSAHQVVTTIYDDDIHLFPAIQAGANGYLLKDEPRQVIADALKNLATGTPPLSPQITQRMMNYFQQVRSTPLGQEGRQDTAGMLSSRERQVLEMIARGFKTAEVADILDVSYHTAARHIKNIYAKLGISSRAEAVQEAIRLGLYNPHG